MGQPSTGINRYIMECKFIMLQVVRRRYVELIDTLWNVNFIYGISVISINCELIDTLWNVNI